MVILPPGSALASRSAAGLAVLNHQRAISVSIIQQIWSNPSSISRCDVVDEMSDLPFASSHAALDQAVDGVLMPWEIVPDVARHAGHSRRTVSVVAGGTSRNMER